MVTGSALGDGVLGHHHLRRITADDHPVVLGLRER